MLFILLCFRLHGYAVQADISDALRFLWYKHREIQLQMSTRLFGGVWCASSSVHALRRTILDNINVDPWIKESILDSMYVDDLMQSVSSREDKHKIVIGVPATLQTGGFSLTKFSINDRELVDDIPIVHHAEELHVFSSRSVGKTLGVK